jgi:hypothetical protein
MRSPALALGWELWAKHRWGWSVIAAGALAAAVLVRILSDDTAQIIGVVAMVAMIGVYLYVMSIFVYAETSLSSKAAGFPARLFTLPMRTGWLVAWPMIFGMVSVILLWIWLIGLVLLPCHLARELDWWPGLMLATYLAVFQTICWTLVKVPLIRLILAILILPSVAMIGGLVWATKHLEITKAQATLGLAGFIGVAYLLAVVGVARERRGDRISWAWIGRLLQRAAPSLAFKRKPFSSPLAAQRWLEIRRHAWLLPAFVGFFLAMLFWAMALPLSATEVAQVVAAMVGFPIMLAFFCGFGMGKTSFWARDLRLTSFIATRPLSAAALGAAKLRAAAIAAVATWALILLLFPLWTALSENAAIVRELFNTLFGSQPAWKLGLLAPLILAGLIGMTWLQLVGGMCLSLSGRFWVVNAIVLIYLVIVAALIALFVWSGSHPQFVETLITVLWWLGGSLGLLKLAATARMWSRINEADRGRLVSLSVSWAVVAACLLMPLYALIPDNPVPTHLIALYVLLALPLNRLLALPAAVAWNRHR